ncbi:protein ALP1-like isoform X2 [Malania oleifera]|uniref:protein ALP1-like isoform X2 n=1 Tax=Malania oleifera TaxID=397392 RepID=UPI0025AE5883|nr:protein ALP1-like isoform X2 [Malania oleifera]
MGPIRGLKKRRKMEKKVGSSDEGSEDWWDEFSKRITAGLLSSSKGLDKFESVFKISRKTFNYICSLVKEDMMAKPGNFIFTNGRPLSLNDLVAVALRRLSSGESLVTIADSFGLNHSTVSQVTWRFVESMEERGLHHLQWPSTEAEMAEIKSKFEKIRGLPNCCGVIDTTHIMMCLPSGDPSTKVWLDREKNHSMILQAIVDPDMRFRDIVTGWPGKMDDSLVLQSSNFFKLCEKGKKLNGKKMELSEESELREYIVGDSGFPLLPWLVTPYQGKELPESRAEFNRRHFATRMVAQRALARLKEMWKIIQGVMWRPDKHKLPRIILVCCLLHNIVIDLEDEVQDEMPLSHLHDSGYRQQISESVDKSASILRDKLSLYLSGRLPP